MFFGFVWIVDIVIGLIALAFFVAGLNDGSISSFNLLQWTLLLGAIVTVVFGSFALSKSGHTKLASTLAALPAIPAIIIGVGLMTAIATGVRWN